MGLGYIAIGILFLFNPNIHVFDLLPDCFGVLLIYRGLFRASFSTEKLKDARTALWKLAIVTGVRLLSVVFIPGASDSLKLLLSFVFGVLEILFAVPAILHIFGGFYDLGRRYDALSVYGRRRNRRGEIVETSERLKRFTVFFFLLKATLSVLPELTALQLRYDLSPEAVGAMRFSDFKPLFYVFSVTLTLAVGIPWLVRALRYVTELRRDGNLSGGVSAYYELNVASDEGVVAALQMKNGFLLIILSALFSFPLQFDGVAVLPFLFTAIPLGMTWRILARYGRSAFYGYIPTVLAALFSIVSLIVQIPYFSEYDAPAARYVATAIRAYKTVRTMGTIEHCIALVTFVYFVIILYRVLRRHTYLAAGIVSHSQYSAESRAAEILAGIRGRIWFVALSGVLHYALRAVSFTASMYYPAFWLAPAATAVLFLVAVVYMTSGCTDLIYDRLENKY